MYQPDTQKAAALALEFFISKKAKTDIYNVFNTPIATASALQFS